MSEESAISAASIDRIAWVPSWSSVTVRGSGGSLEIAVVSAAASRVDIRAISQLRVLTADRKRLSEG